jgi:putative nucleotidyltransferase with HDIG domain
VLLRNESGEFSSSHQGDPALVKHLLARLQACFQQLLATDGRRTLTLSEPNDPRMALAALVPGVDGTMGVLCLGRNGRAGAFLPDEKELLLAYAQNSALALQKLALRETAESNLVNTIAAFVNAIESKDDYLKGHSARVSLYAEEIATVMGMPHDEVLVVCRGGILHDLGKLAILDPILSKPGRLTPEEYELVKAHTEVGDKILKPLGFLRREAKAVRHHHERYDGKGYPDKLAGDDIPLIARVVAVADAFDAMTSDRAYRKALPVEAAIAQIEQGAGTQFDPVVARAFLTVPRARLLEISGYWAAALETAATGG